MCSVAWRRWDFEALDVCSGPANTTIVHMPVMASHHGSRRSYAALSWPTVSGRDGPQRIKHIICLRLETMDCCSREGENVEPRTRGPGVAVRRLFGSLRLRSRPRGALRRGSRRCNSPRCLKPLATSLEARGRQLRRAENCRGGRKPWAGAMLTFRGRAFCRGLLRRPRSRVYPRDGLCASSGWLRRPGG
jgi:hypothetical protein